MMFSHYALMSLMLALLPAQYEAVAVLNDCDVLPTSGSCKFGTIEEVTDADFTGNFLYKVNVGGDGTNICIGDTVDPWTSGTATTNSDGIQITFPSGTPTTAGAWLGGADYSGIPTGSYRDMLSSIIYVASGNPNQFRLVFSDNIEAGKLYKIQLFFPEKNTATRTFKISVDGTDYVPRYRADEYINPLNTLEVAYFALEYEPTASSITVDLTSIGEGNPVPILSGITIEEVENDPVCLQEGLVSYWRGEDNAVDSVGDNDGFLNGCMSYADGQIGRAFEFDGVDDFIVVPDDDATLGMTGSYSFQAWVYVDDSTVSEYRPIAVRGSGQQDDIEIYVQPPNTSKDLIVAHNRGNGGTFDYVGFSDPPLQQWFHLVVTYDGTVKAYYDGSEATVVQQTSDLAPPLYTNKPWNFGTTEHNAFRGSPWLNPFFIGKLDEISLYNTALSSDEVTRIYNEGVCDLTCSGQYDQLLEEANQLIENANQLMQNANQLLDAAADLECAPSSIPSSEPSLLPSVMPSEMPTMMPTTKKAKGAKASKVPKGSSTKAPKSTLAPL